MKKIIIVLCVIILGASGLIADDLSFYYFGVATYNFDPPFQMDNPETNHVSTSMGIGLDFEGLFIESVQNVYLHLNTNDLFSMNRFESEIIFGFRFLAFEVSTTMRYTNDELTSKSYWETPSSIQISMDTRQTELYTPNWLE